MAPPPSATLPASSVCPACGAGLRCGMVTGDSTCWCYNMPRVIPVPPVADGQGGSAKSSCLCPDCLKKLIASHDLQPSSH